MIHDIVLFLKQYTLKRKVVRDEERAVKPDEVIEEDRSADTVSPARTIREDLDEEKEKEKLDDATSISSRT